jgi:DDE superfamily endonuclease
MYLIAGDEVMVTKAGKSTHGLDRFFASLYGKRVPGLSFFTVSLVSVHKRDSVPLRLEQVVRSDAEKAVRKANADAKKAKLLCDKRRPWRPKGSPNNKKVAVTFTPELGRIKAMLDA